MSVGITLSPQITPAIPEDDLTGDTTLDDTGSDLLSECSKVWTTKHSATVNARVSSSRQLLKSVAGKKSLEEVNKEVPTVFMEVTQEVSYDVLATEFLTQNYSTIDTRVLMLDKLIPCLAVSIQRLLMQVVKLGVVREDVKKSGFNPINFLAQQLMRNNPRYNTTLESSPYVVGIRLASDEMRRRMFAMEESRLAKIKADAKLRRDERMRQKILKKEREQYRQRELQKSYEDWVTLGLTTLTRLPIFSALTSFRERSADIENISLDNYTIPDRDVFVNSETLGNGEEFAMLLFPTLRLIASDTFEVFKEHLKDCGSSYRLSLIREKRRYVLGNVFRSIDGRVDGKLNRHRIVQLFTAFYEHADNSTQNTLVDPKTFGISEFEQDIINESLANDVIDNSDNDDIVRSGSQVIQSVESETKLPQLDTENGTIRPDALNEVIVNEQEQISGLTTEPLTMDNSISSGNTAKEQTIPDAQQEANIDKKYESQQDNINTQVVVQENIVINSEVTDEDKNICANGITEEQQDSVKEEELNNLQKNSEKIPSNIEDNPSENSTKHSPVVSTANLNAIQEESNHDETTNGLLSLDVTIAVEDGAIDSQDTTQDIQTDKSKATQSAIQSESRFFGIKSAQLLRAKALSRLANVDLTRVVTRSNTPMDYASPGLPWNVDFISVEQFGQLTEFFWGICPQPELVETILTFISEGYTETEYEKEERIREEWLQTLKSSQSRHLIRLYTMWDNDRAGYIDRKEFSKIIISWPRSGEFSKLSKLGELLDVFPFKDESVATKEEILTILTDVCLCLEDETDFQGYIEFIQRSIKLTNEEKQRGKTRTEWLENIITLSRTCGLSFTSIFKTALGCIYKDNENYGCGKRARCNVALLEYLQGKKALHYVTASQDDHEGVVGKVLREENKCVGFSVIKSGRMIHIPKILETKQNIHIFYPKRKVLDRERDGSFICCPLLHPNGHVIGVLGIDTLAEMEKKQFSAHEVSFYQGVARTLGEAYSHVELRIKLVKILHSAFRWTLSKVESINSITVFIVEDPPTERPDEGYILRRVLTMYQGERDPVEDANPPRIFRKDDVFKDYLFVCAENSEPISTETFGRLHWTIPVRDSEGNPMAVIDIEIRGRLTKPDEENIHWMARLVTIAVLELSQGYREPPKPHVLSVEGIDEENRLVVLFSRVLLTDLRRNVEKLDSEAYAEIKSYIDPPKVIHDVLRAVLYIFNPNKHDAFKQWRNCKQSVNIDLSRSIATYDPTSFCDEVQVNELQLLLSVVPVGEVEKHGSQPAKCLHDWSLVCLSLLEHTQRMREAFGTK